MRIAETKVYQFAELSDSAKEKARDWYRTASANNFNDFHGDCVIEDAKQCGAFIGLDIDKVFYSGFSSQGDGACFVGSWSASAVKPGELASHAPQDKELHRIAAEFEAIASKYPEAGFSVKHRGHYSHENCTYFDVNMGEDEETHVADEVDADQYALIEAAKDFMRWIYRQLEKEWDYQNADEQVDESIIANEYEFTEFGKRY